MAVLEDQKPIYDAFQDFLDHCVRDDRSLLWTKSDLWKISNVRELKRRVVDTPMFGQELSFEEKLVKQMEGCDPELWQMIADIYYVYFLPSDFITLEKKMHDIRWAAEQGGFQVPQDQDKIWEAQKLGYTRTSFKYHSKYAQFWLIILFSLRVKESGDAEKIINKPDKMQALLDDILDGIPENNDRAYDMRHAMLYMAFPDHYERSISTRDKEKILKEYESVLDTTPEDLDQAVYQVRKRLPEVRDDISKDFDFYTDLKDEWRSKKRPPKVEKEDVDTVKRELAEESAEYSTDNAEIIDNIIDTLSHTKNLILYGPPGTGKTYLANKVAEALIKPSSSEGISDEAKMQEVSERLTFHEVLALGMYISGPNERYSVPELQKLKLIQAHFQFSPVKHPSNMLWGYLQRHSSPESQTINIGSRSEPYLFDKDHQSRWYLTDTGNQYVQESLGEEINYLQSREDEVELDTFVEWVTFHQSYSYEEFVEGLRPISSEENPGEITYDVVPGSFKKISKRASVDPENNYVMIIDEINRGNIAKIFGELITLIEDDKRKGEENEMSVSLAYTPDNSFSVPNNLFIIGTMNTADRSIALLDVALRRRFAFQEIMPSPELLDDIVVESPDAAVNMGELLRSINEKIIAKLDRDHQIGHSYFLPLEDVEEDERLEVLDHIWNHKIFPLLREYFYSQPEELFEILLPMYDDVSMTKQDLVLSSVDYQFEQLSGEDLLYALSMFAENSEGSSYD